MMSCVAYRGRTGVARSGWDRRAVLSLPLAFAASSAGAQGFEIYDRLDDSVPPGGLRARSFVHPPPPSKHNTHPSDLHRAQTPPVPPEDDPSWRRAQAILDAAPIGGRPYDVATYFLEAIPPRFQSAWTQASGRGGLYANPLILLFFLSTNLHPSGDQTPWCSAFADWCLGRVGISGTHDAGALSWLHWGEEVWRASDGLPPTRARPGDIAVFRHRGLPGRGHVAFFRGVTRDNPNSVDVLGGNQRATTHQHIICVKSYAQDGPIELISIRTAPGLRSA